MINLFLLNTVTLGEADILNILSLAGITKEMDFDSEILNARAGVKQLLKLVKLYYERNETCTYISKFTVKLGNEKSEVDDVIAVKNEIRLVCDENQGNNWYLVTETDDGNRFEKEISSITDEDEQETFLCGLSSEKLLSHLNNHTVNSLDNHPSWTELKSKCFSHPNPLQEIGALLRRDLDGAKNNIVDKEIRNLRSYLNKRAKNENTSLILYSNKVEADSCGHNESQYVKSNIENELSKNQHLGMLYIGGGHGWPKQKWHGMLSGIKSRQVMEIHNTLSKKRVVINTIVLGSCFSASFANDFSDLLHPEYGVMLSSTLSQGGSNFFGNVVSIALQEENGIDFFNISQQNNQTRNPTGMCISKKGQHIGLELSKNNTGLPYHSAEDEYGLSLDIVKELIENKPQSIFSNSLDLYHDEQQKGEFNNLLNKSLENKVSPPSPMSPLVKFTLFTGGALLFGGALVAGSYLYKRCNNHNDPQTDLPNTLVK